MTAGPRSATFFRSRWVPRPAAVTELSPDELPGGFRSAAVACGIKSSGELDLGVLFCDVDDASSAARFTRNALVAAPVEVSRRAELSRLRAVVVNSGNANVSSGDEGLAVAEAMVEATGRGLGVETQRVGVASTGVIGQGLAREPVLRGISAAVESLSASAGDFAGSILTTDRGPKYGALELALSSGATRLAAQAKGGGMIAPSLATMLCFIESDARIDHATLNRLLDAAIERSFARISVDGQTSTNDSVFMFASGVSGVAVEPGSDDEHLFAEALDALLKQLALEVVADGEGATRVARLQVHGGAGATEPVARSVANSPLVKCALFGGDPNWGRILQAAGQVLPDTSPIELHLSIEDIDVARASVAVPLADFDRQRLERSMRESEIEMRLAFADEEEESEIYFSDLGYDYVRLNAEYPT